ncbi:MAG: ankyrin repeat domain-containing protein [Bacteroides sp.]|nr:ankyrin repeat domain-containing protein [Bacteroides sp.]
MKKEKTKKPTTARKNFSDTEKKKRLNEKLLLTIRQYNVSEITSAILAKWKKQIETLLLKGADVNAKDKNGMTILHHLAQFNAEIGLSLLPVLEKYRINPRLVDKMGRTPLFYMQITYQNSIEFIKALINLGVDPKRKDRNQEDVISYMIHHGIKLEAIPLL